MPEDADITRLLNSVDRRDRGMVDRLVARVYPDLEALAHRHLYGERADHTLNTNALVHEAYLRLAQQEGAPWESRAHFFGIAALTMRRILISYARARKAEKRGGSNDALTLIEDGVAREARPEEFLALDEALDRLAEVAERPARIIEMWFFGGLTQPEIAEALGISEITVRRDWRKARAWLSTALADE